MPLRSRKLHAQRPSTNDCADALGLGICTNQPDGSWLQLAAGDPWYRGKKKKQRPVHTNSILMTCVQNVCTIS